MACDSVSAGGASFQLCEAPRTWAETAGFCRARGLELAWVDDETQSRELGEALRRRGSKDRWWLGLSDAAEEGDFRWTSGGGRSAAPKWSKGQPDDGACGEDCAALKASGKWSDAHCQLRRPFICR